MASGKSKPSFCIDSLLAQDKLPANDPASTQPQLVYGDPIRFRSNLFGGLHPAYSAFEAPVEQAKQQGEADGERDAGDGRQSSSSSKEDASGEASVTQWHPASAIGRPAVPTSGPPPMGSSAYPAPMFTNPAAALHAAAAAAAAAVAASSPSAHQFHSAHLEWLARAGVLYHRFGGDLTGQSILILKLKNHF